MCYMGVVLRVDDLVPSAIGPPIMMLITMVVGMLSIDGVGIGRSSWPEALVSFEFAESFTK